MKHIEGATYIGTLPKSDHEWGMADLGGMVILTNPDHEPRVIIDGKLEILTPAAGLERRFREEA